MLLNFNFIKIYVIQKTIVLIKNHLNYLKDSIFECIIDFYFLKKNMNFFHNIKNIFILKKEIKNRIIRDIRDLFKHKEEQEHYYRPVRVGNV